MKKSVLYTLLTFVAIASAITSCVRDDFRYYGYENQLEGYFPVDSIESGHDWTLTSVCTSLVKGSVPGAAKVRILSGDPFSEDGVEILAEASTTSGISRNMTYLVPKAQTTIVAAAQDASGNYLRVVKAGVNSDVIDLGSTTPTGTANTVTPQRMFYCFEADYPNPGDWDYNDIVMSITKEPTDDEEVIALHVTLDAVGYMAQIAAGIRLTGGYKNDEVTISRDEATTFVRYPDRERTIIKSSDLQLKSLTGEPVINLFDDAHLALYHLSYVDNATVVRKCFNTYTSSNSNGAIQPAVTVTYYIDFHDAYTARHFTLAEIDPFIVVRYGTSGENFWEVHTYPYKLSEVLFNYYNGAAASYNNGFSWALAIPYANFRYPAEAIMIGLNKGTITGGAAYVEKGHSFGEWMLDHTIAQDWYLYPASGAVY